MLRLTLITLLLGLSTAGCAAPPTPVATDPPAPVETETLVAETEVSIPLPTITPVTPLPENLPPNLPADFTPNELAAAMAEESVYSGYECSMTTDSCTCDEPTIMRVRFTFEPGNLLTYQFRTDLSGATWEMSRLGPDQWNYIIKIGSAESDAGSGGNYFYLMTMQPTGFTMTQRRESGGVSVTCPAAAFTRMGS